MRIVIVGGGITGLTTAYNLAKMGADNVKVFEKRYINSGSSTRNASHFRVHFWSKENALFAIKSRKIILNLANETGWNPVFHQSGYLWLLHSEEQLKAFKKSNEMWKSLGVGEKILQMDEVKEMFPYIKTDDYIAAFYGPQNGKVHHDHVSLGYYSAAKKLGVEFYEHTKVEKIIIEENRVKGVKTNRGDFKADIVVVAAGVWSRKLLNTCNVDIPVEPERKEICVTEPVKHFIDPLVIDMKTGAYVGQTIRGEIIGSVDKPKIRGLVPQTNTLMWASTWARYISNVIPCLKYIKIMRAWSGYYAVTPDHSHILGRDPEWPEGLYVHTGYSGHGFMMSPYGGKVLAHNILTGEVPKLMKPFLPTRFKEGKLVKETMVIG